MSSLRRSALSPPAPGSSASSSRTVKPRDYSHLNDQPSTSTNGRPVASSSPVRPTTLSSAADDLRIRLLGQTPSHSTTALDLDDLTGCLYLLKQLLDEGDQAIGPRRRRRRAAERAREDARTVLQASNELLSRSAEDDDESEEASNERPSALVALWSVERGGKATLRALDLLLDPSLSQISLLSHPALVDAVEQLWHCGRPSASSSDSSSTVQTALTSLDRLCTPRYLHALAFVSKLANLVLVLSLLFRPGSLVPDRQDGRAPGAWSLNRREVLWIIFSVGAVVEIATTRPTYIPLSTSLPLISLLLALLSTTESSALAYPVLAVSIVPLFLSLISSTAPALPHLFPSSSLLPLSTYTSSLLSRLWKPSLLFLPLAGALFVALAWSLNGDIWRLGIHLPTEPPGEISVAPFAVRMWLAIALAVVLAGWVVVSCSRCRGAEAEGETLAVEAEDVNSDLWAAEWGKGAARRARVARTSALRRYLILLAEVAVVASDATSDSERQPLIIPPPSSDLARTRVRRPLSPIVPLPSPLNLLIFVAGTVPSLAVARLPSSDPVRRQAQATRWELAVERWVWRAVALLSGLRVWDFARTRAGGIHR